MLRISPILLLLAIVALVRHDACLANFDGFNVDSATFASQYTGIDIFDANTETFGAQWDFTGGSSTSSLSNSGATLVVNNNGNNGWLQQDSGSSPWEGGTGSWSLEVRAKLTDNSADNDGFTIWTDLNGENQIVWIQDDSVNLLDGTELLGGIDNTDGFHDFRVAYDDTLGSYHVWRDGTFVTAPGGIAARTSSSDTRVIVGDCCTGIGNPIDQWEIDYVRYDMNGAFSPTDINTLTLQVNSQGVEQR